MKISVYIATTLDGFIAREDGRLDWLPGSDPDDQAQSEIGSAEDYGYASFMQSVDVLIMGRKTYEMVRSFGAWSYGEKPVVVLSSQPHTISIPPELSATVTADSSDPAALVAKHRANGATHLYIDGGNTIQRFLAVGLITEIIITCIPILIGTGIPLFGSAHADIKLHHIETRSFENGLVQSTYQVKHASKQPAIAHDSESTPPTHIQGNRNIVGDHNAIFGE